MTLTLILGGARSGKSRYAKEAAEAAAERTGRRPILIATAEPLDDEMAERIQRHRQERGPDWRTIEAPLQLAEALAALPAEDPCVVDCLTLWLANSLHEPAAHAERTEALLCELHRRRTLILLVSNEVGGGIVPDNAAARRFRDEAGRLHQSLAEIADEVVLVIAGLPLRLKGETP